MPKCSGVLWLNVCRAFIAILRTQYRDAMHFVEVEEIRLFYFMRDKMISKSSQFDERAKGIKNRSNLLI